MLALTFTAPGAVAEEEAQLFVTEEQGYGRLILSFPDRDTLPAYSVRLDNGVLSIEFEEPVSVLMPDVAVTLPDYISVARVDPDQRGVRFGLRTSLNFNRIEAGEKLFIDLLPLSWQGLPPSLPQAVIDELAERARLAAIEAERQRKARDVLDLNPRAEVAIGRNPTFLRLAFHWNVDTGAEYAFEAETGQIAFEWPVEVDLRDLALDLPPEILDVDTAVTPDGALVRLHVAEGVEPRFFANSPRDFVLDIDLAGHTLPELDAAALEEQAATAAAEAKAAAEAEQQAQALAAEPTDPVTPFVNVLGSTVRVVFPFERDVPAAVFRRGDTLWMMFDTARAITPPNGDEKLDGIASAFEVMAAGTTQVVRMDLARDRLATLGSEGRAWVLSLGDVLLAPTEPVTLDRRLNLDGVYEMTANLARPAEVHEFRDPFVGDVLQVVTAYPPARGVMRQLDYVDFDALRSVHGLVIRPEHGDVDVHLESQAAVITAPNGLIVSSLDRSRDSFLADDVARDNYVDLGVLKAGNPGEFATHRGELLTAAARAEGAEQDAARLELAQYLVANGFAIEAIGVLRVLENEIENEELTPRVRMTLAMANVLAGREGDALALLESPLLAEEIDAVLWRVMARVADQDFYGAKQDALLAAPILESYPDWVRARFYLAAIRAAVETRDARMAGEFFERVDFAALDLEQASRFHLLSARLDELEGRTHEALDTYGQVIAADIRPTRAEAVYRTLRILDETGTLDLAKATETLAAESMLWRGDALEVEMQAMLADFYFRKGQYRFGFEVVRQMVANFTGSPSVNALQAEAQTVFTDLFLNGMADALEPIDALGLYYDFRHLTPPGTRGDEMIRNLARRLVEVDLLASAAELLEYQMVNRLEGVARSQVAADLAVIYLADRQPAEALRVLSDSRLADVSATLTRQRRVLEARALIEAGRHVLALDLMRDMQGGDIDQLRIDANWKAGRYAEAAAMLEARYFVVDRPLTEIERMNVVKAAVGYVLADDRFGLSRLRSKFAERLATTPEWAMFDYVTSAVEPQSLEFRKVAREVAALDGLESFLAAYRDVYEGGGALTPLSASTANPTLASR